MPRTNALQDGRASRGSGGSGASSANGRAQAMVSTPTRA
ncbi:hypothetical protein HNR06_000570 [Nocardiopsis arvandica]|uniref:Uncharacterized protein n=1 Tax=Nocardiopsis sinuspersici TaxID=501010 RepID=A0A7Y9X870_9ACTN|nr:hypothetical protein [Nocardiopsis sinuspersici]